VVDLTKQWQLLYNYAIQCSFKRSRDSCWPKYGWTFRTGV